MGPCSQFCTRLTPKENQQIFIEPVLQGRTAVLKGSIAAIKLHQQPMPSGPIMVQQDPSTVCEPQLCVGRGYSKVFLQTGPRKVYEIP